MIQYTTLIQRFHQQGEKTGWTYIEIPEEMAEALNPGVKVSFRIKGKLDQHAIQKMSLLPMGGGNFILPLNTEVRKEIRKRQGDTLHVTLELDDSQVELSADLLACFEDAPDGKVFFDKLPKSHQNYYSKWIESAKSEETKSKRITITVQACVMHMRYNEMMRWLKGQKKEF
jgi:hypothetical protein